MKTINLSEEAFHTIISCLINEKAVYEVTIFTLSDNLMKANQYKEEHKAYIENINKALTELKG